MKKPDKKEIGKIGGILNKFKFNYVVKPDLAVLDFGCGGGYLLSTYDCAKKVGVELNPHARTVAAEFGIETYASIHEVPSEYVDVIISNHAMEHVENPLEILKQLFRVLKPGGFYLNVSLSRETQRFYEFYPRSSESGEFQKYGVHYHFFEKEEIKGSILNY